MLSKSSLPQLSLINMREGATQFLNQGTDRTVQDYRSFMIFECMSAQRIGSGMR